MEIEILLKCFLIGILVSAPMGPIGMLCIQRTISRGMAHGLISGAGAVLSDLIYALLTGFGMSIVIDWIEGNRFILQLVGSVLMILFGIIVVRTHPKKLLRNRSGTTNSYVKEFTTAFFLTFANALIIFYFIALFARFNFPDPRFPLWLDALGYLFIILGAMAWWTTITFIISHLRKQFNVRMVMIINRVIGSLIICVSIIGMAYAILELTV